MTELFLKTLNLSISASYLVLAIFLLRFLLKKAPKWANVLLWGLVAFRLVCPISLESALSLIPSAEVVSPNIMRDPTPTISTGIEAVNRVVNPVITETFAPDPVASANPLQIFIPVAANIWLLGILLMTLYTLFSYLRLHHRVKTAVRLKDNIYQCETVASPFVLGVFRPQIYLPFDMNQLDMYHVIAHERCHIRRRDHWWKPLGFLLLTLHWFNPLLWVAYIFLCKDIELACDEKVVRHMNPDQRANYSQALLHCAISHRSIAACPIAFGEVSVKDRIQNVLSYKHPASWVILISLTACIVAAVCFLTNPRQPDTLQWLQQLRPEDVRYMEYITPIAEPSQQYHLYQNEELAEALDVLSSFNGTYVPTEEVEPIAGGSYDLHIVLPSGDHTVTNIANVYLVIDGDYYEDTYSHLSNGIGSHFKGTTYLPAAENQSLKVSMSVESVSPTGITILFDNYDTGGDHVLWGGNHYFLQIEENGTWTDLPTLTDPIFTTESYTLDNIRRHTIDWQWLYGTLSDGHYRIGKSVTLHIGASAPAIGQDGLMDPDGANKRTSTVYAEFDIETIDWGVSLTAEDITADKFILRFVNDGSHPGQDFYHIAGYTLETYKNGTWQSVPPVEGREAPTWHETTTYIDFEAYARPDSGMYMTWKDHYGLLPDGTYRLGKQLCTAKDPNAGERIQLYVQFSLPADAQPSPKPLSDLPENYGLEQAEMDGCLVTENLEPILGQHHWQTFLEAVNSGSPAYIRNMHYFNQDGTAMRTLYDLTFDGSTYTLVWLENGTPVHRTYQYLRHFEGESGLPNAAYDAIDAYILTDHPTATYDELFLSLASSQAGAAIPHHTVYTDYIYYPDTLTVPVLSKAELVDNGKTYAAITDLSTLEALHKTLSRAEWLGYYPKTPNFGPQLRLTAESGEIITAQLDIQTDLLAIGQECYDYGPGNDAYGNNNDIALMWQLFGLTEWTAPNISKWPAEINHRYYEDRVLDDQVQNRLFAPLSLDNGDTLTLYMQGITEHPLTREESDEIFSQLKYAILDKVYDGGPDCENVQFSLLYHNAAWNMDITIYYTGNHQFCLKNSLDANVYTAECPGLTQAVAKALS